MLCAQNLSITHFNANIALEKGIHANSFLLMRQALSSGANPTIGLRIAVASNNILAVGFLLMEGKAEINALHYQPLSIFDKFEWGHTVLHKAAGLGFDKMVHELISYGALPYVSSYVRKLTMPDHTPVKHLSDPISGVVGTTPLHCAAQGGHIQVAIRLLADIRVNVNATTIKGETALHWAAREGHVDMVKLLLEANANFRIPNKAGLTPMMLAAFCNQVSVATVLSYAMLQRPINVIGHQIELDYTFPKPLVWNTYKAPNPHLPDVPDTKERTFNQIMRRYL